MLNYLSQQALPLVTKVPSGVAAIQNESSGECEQKNTTSYPDRVSFRQAVHFQEPNIWSELNIYNRRGKLKKERQNNDLI